MKLLSSPLNWTTIVVCSNCTAKLEAGTPDLKVATALFVDADKTSEAQIPVVICPLCATEIAVLDAPGQTLIALDLGETYAKPVTDFDSLLSQKKGDPPSDVVPSDPKNGTLTEETPSDTSSEQPTI